MSPEAIPYNRSKSITPYWCAIRFRRPAADSQPVREGPVDHALLAKGGEDLSVRLGHDPSLVGHPMCGDGDGLLNGAKHVERHDLARRPVGEKRFEGWRTHLAYALDGIANGGEPRADSTASINHERRRPARRGPRPAR